MPEAHGPERLELNKAPCQQIRAAAKSYLLASRLPLKPLSRARSAVRAARPATGATFALLKFFKCTLDSAAARCCLSCRGNPADPFVPRQRRQISPGCLHCLIRTERFAQVRRRLVQRAGFTQIIHPHALSQREANLSHPRQHYRASRHPRRLLGRTSRPHKIHQALGESDVCAPSCLL